MSKYKSNLKKDIQMKIYPENPKLYSQRIKASCKYYVDNFKMLESKSDNPMSKKVDNILRKFARRIIKMDDAEIVKECFGNERTQLSLKALRLLNKGIRFKKENEKKQALLIIGQP